MSHIIVKTLSHAVVLFTLQVSIKHVGEYVRVEEGREGCSGRMWRSVVRVHVVYSPFGAILSVESPTNCGV